MRRQTRSLCFAAALLAAVPGSAEVRVSGRVEIAGGAPLAGAPVRLLPARDSHAAGLDLLAGRAAPDPTAETLTGEDGGFELAAPEPGLWEVRVAADGFVPMAARLQPLIEETVLPAVALRPDRPLTVVVLDPTGEPVPGAVVTGQTQNAGVWATRAMERRQWSKASSYGIADGDGLVTLPRAAGERVAVRAGAPGFAPAEPRQGSGQRLDLRLRTRPPIAVAVRDAAGQPVEGALIAVGRRWWAAGVTDAGGRLEVVLTDDRSVRALTAGGAQAHVRAPDGAEAVRLTLTEPTVIAGRVIDAESRDPLAGALVWSQRASGEIVRSERDGRFRLPAMARGGASSIRAAAPGFFEQRLEVDESQPFEPVLALRPAAAAAGEVVDADGQPVVGAKITARLVPDSPGSLRAMRSMSEGARGRSDETGGFRLAGLSPGLRLEVEAAAPGFAPAIVHLDPIEPRHTRTGVRLVLNAGISLSGRVLGAGEPVAGAELSLLRDPEGSSPMRLFARRMMGEEQTATSGAEGGFEYRDLRPGSYRLRVSAPGFATLLLPGVRVGAGGADLGAVELEPGAEIRGVVVDGNGRPIAGAEVQPSSSEQQAIFGAARRDRGEPATVTGADGAFVVPDRRPGSRVDLEVTHEDHLPATAAGVSAPTVEPVRIVLRRAAKIAGRVFAADGAPIAGATILVRVEESDDGRTGGGLRYPANARSDDAGHFEVEQVPTGTVLVMASAPGRLSAELGALELAAGQELSGLRLVLERGATVSGRVLGTDGRPAAAVRVWVEESRTLLSFGRGATATTDGDGRYTLQGVAPGRRTILAQDDERNRAAGELEVTRGVNRLDLRFAGGVEISGRVVDDAGAPVAGATVTALSDARTWQGAQAVSDGDGAFTVEGLRDGQYQLRVSREGYAAKLLDERLQIAGAPLSGIEVVLTRGGAITGSLLGLDEDQLPLVTVVATGGASQWSIGQASHDGTYRIPDLGPGDWNVQAMVPQGPQAQGRITLDPGAAEAVLDLEFSTGLVLTGQVLRSGEPLTGVQVMLRGIDVGSWNDSGTDHEGRFRIEGLEAGRHRLEVGDYTSALRHHEEVQIDGDREIVVEIFTGRIAGRVLDAEDLSPLAGAMAVLEPVDAGPARSIVPLSLGQVESDSAGRFVIAPVAAAAYRLRVVKADYAPGERLLSVAPDGDLADLEIRLEPTAGLGLRVLGASGAPVGEISYAVLDGFNRSLTGGTRLSDENGYVRLPSVPDGGFDLLLSAPGAAVRRLRLEAPGPTVTVTLETACTLEVAVADLAGDKLLARMRITGADGQPFLGLTFGGVWREWELHLGAQTVTGLPAGSYNVEVETPDGRGWRGSARVAPGATNRLDL